MKIKSSISLLLFICLATSIQAQSVFGKWKTVNDETGKANSIIEIYERDDAVYGRVIKILKEEDKHRKCTECAGHLKDKPIEGLELMRGLEKDGNEYVGGLITDPKSGKEYKCKIWIDKNNPDVLNVRGYIAFFFRTQNWQRVE